MNLIEKLTYAEKEIQTDALDEAAESYDFIKDELHAALALGPDAVKALESESGRVYVLKYFAMCLAAEHRDVEAFPLIINFFASYDQDAWDCLGEIMTRDMGRILASVSPGNISALKAAVELPCMNSFARISCFDALGTLMCEGIISRDDLIQCFRTWLEDDRLDLFEHSALAKACVDLSLWEMQQDLLVMLESECIDPEAISKEKIEDLKNSDLDDLMAHMFSLIYSATKVIEEIRVRDYLSILGAMYDYDEIEALSPLFKKDEENNETITPEYLHGFMFAIVITPSLILPSEWLPVLFGSCMPALETTDEDMETSMLGLMEFYNHLNNDRLDGLLHCPFDQLFQIDAGLAPMATRWCEGFGVGIALRRQYWIEHQMSDEFKYAMSTIMMLSDEKIAIDLLKQSGIKNNSCERNKLFQQCLANLCFAVDELIRYADENGAENSPDSMPYLSPEPVRSNKVGRNTPCPCGSGKKFKKCCGVSARSVH